MSTSPASPTNPCKSHKSSKSHKYQKSPKPPKSNPQSQIPLKGHKYKSNPKSHTNTKSHIPKHQYQVKPEKSNPKSFTNPKSLTDPKIHKSKKSHVNPTNHTNSCDSVNMMITAWTRNLLHQTQLYIKWVVWRIYTCVLLLQREKKEEPTINPGTKLKHALATAPKLSAVPKLEPNLVSLQLGSLIVLSIYRDFVSLNDEYTFCKIKHISSSQ